MRWVWLLVVALVGCRGMTINTRDRISVEGPVDTRVTADLAPVSNPSPVAPNAVPSGGPAAYAAGSPGGRVAVIDVDGLLLNTGFVGPYSLGENPVALFREKLDAAAADPCVRAVVLRVNSPGGGVAACVLMRSDLIKFKERTRLPTVACLLDVAAGGSYYLATACDQVVAAPGGVVGGVGVILNLYNLRDLMGQYNVVPQEVKAGEFTDLGSPARKLSPEGQKILQGIANEFHAAIKAEVRRARPGLDPADDSALDGRIFSSAQAKARGLTDAVGDLDDAVALARQLANAPGADAVLYRRSNDPARSVYAVTPNMPLQAGAFPSLPGLDRARLPTFLCVWQPELALERAAGK
jgi:protease IV